MNEVLDPRWGETVFHNPLEDGLDIWAVLRKGSRQKAAILCVEYGSVDLDLKDQTSPRILKNPAGTAHFLEHRLFEKRYGDITERFNVLGGEVNASTSFTTSVFSLTCIENFTANLDLLFELVLDLEISPEGIDREREIIERELEMGRDDPEWIGFFHGLRALYRDAPLAIDMAGTRESLAQIDVQTLRLCHEVFYRPKFMGIYLCGDIDLEAVCRSAESNLIKYRRGTLPWERVERPVVVPDPQQLELLELPVNRPYSLFFFGDREVGLSGSALLYRELALELALDIAFGPASDFFARHYDDGLIDGDAFGAEVYAEPSFCFSAVGGYTEDCQRLTEEICSTLKGLEALIAEDFSRAKRKAYGQLVRSCEQVEQVADLLCSAALSGVNPCEFFEVYSNISVGEILEVLDGGLSVSQMGAVEIRPMVI